MNKGNNIYEELKSMGSQLADMPRTMPYALPGNYFDHLDGEIQSAIAATAAPDAVHPLPGAGKMPYTLPSGYFEELPDAVLGAIAHQKLKSGNVPEVFAVPEGYFYQLPQKVMEAARMSKPAKSRTISIHIQRLAAAAVILLGIGIGSYALLRPHHSGPDNILVAVPNGEIKEYLQHNMRMDVSNIVAGNNRHVNNIDVDNKDIIHYLNETGWDVVD